MPSSFRQSYGQFITSGAQLILLFIGLQVQSRAGWIVCLALMAAVSLVAWTSTLRRRHAITDIPAARIVSAAQGYVALNGRGKAIEPPLLSHLTRRPCLWYRYQTEERDGRGKWQTVDRGASELSFVLDDGSSQCAVDVEGAEIRTRHKETWRDGSYRHTEWKLLINDAIYALGQLRTIGGGSVDLDARQDLGELLASWKKDPLELRRRFDLDRDGELNEQEWTLARQAARREVARQHKEARDAADVHTLSCPADGRLYLLSNIDEKTLARHYLYWSIFHASIFLGALGTIPWVVQRYF